MDYRKPFVICQLEKIIGKEIKQIEISDILYSSCSYSIDIKGSIIGLSLYNCGISDISTFSSLTRLTSLNLHSNQITDISPLSTLTQLTELILFNNQINDFSPLVNLTKLKTLGLGETQINDLSPIVKLIMLNTLWLEYNQITNLAPLIPLVSAKQLKRLYLFGNNITHLPSEFLQFEIPVKYNSFQGEGIFLQGNPLVSPPIEIVKQGHDAVVSYFNQLKAKETLPPVPLHQCKLLIVGPGEVGKTTLMKKLKDPDFHVQPGLEPTTHGINIIPWELQCTFGECQRSVSVFDRSAMFQQSVSVSDSTVKETVKVFFWDFGGQDIYHATHQFFLTKRSLYILVWEARKEEESRTFDYWLNVIKLLGSSSPVIVVMNKSDERTKNIDEASLKTKFPNIKAFIKISCLNNTGLTELTQLIQTTLEEMPHIRDLLPGSWLHIRDELKTLDQNHIPASQFYEICGKHKIKYDDATVIADYLHDLGTILFFRHDPLLADTVILKPEWATEAVYALIDARPIIDKKGDFLYHELKEYWNPQFYPVSLHPQLIRLMEKFELCFNFIHTDKYFIPELLPGDPIESDTASFSKPGSLQFQYKYEFMPEGILSRFISRLYYLIRENRFRKYSVELQFENATAIVTSQPIHSRIKIQATGPNKSQLLAIIRSHFNHIHQTLNMTAGTHYNELIPCPCRECAAKKDPEEPEYFAYFKLNRAIESHIKEIQCHSSYQSIPVHSLLNGFEPTKSKESILHSIIHTSKSLIGLSKTMKPDEDSRTGFLCALLNEKGFIVKDQTRWGVSGTRQSIGRLDAMIQHPDGTEAIIEAFILKGFDSNSIEKHCKKIFGYDAAGLQNNFIIVYCDCDNTRFTTLWDEYKAYIQNINFEFPLTLSKKLSEEDSGYAEIKIARAVHIRQGQEVGIYHLFLHMK